MARMYHPKTGAELDWVPDVPETIAVFEESGWKMAPEPEEPEPGRAAEPVTYEPVKPEKATAKTTKKST